MCLHPDRISRYIAKLSAPLLDRIDMHIRVQALSQAELITPNTSNERHSPKIRAKVIQVRSVQIERQGCTNAHLSSKLCEQVCDLGDSEQQFLNQAMSKLALSARGYHRLLKVHEL